MLNKMLDSFDRLKKWRLKKDEENRLKTYYKNGRVPWSVGYGKYKNEQIEKALGNASLLLAMRDGSLPDDFGVGLDERIVEIPWALSQLDESDKTILDAGSALNFDFVLSSDPMSNRDLTICTFYPEENSYTEWRISYLYADLRKMNLLDGSFDSVISVSTIEHIDMDNSIYGYDVKNASESLSKSYAYLEAVEEMYRLVKPDGKILISVPFGVYENHGYFQQFDSEMIQRIENLLQAKGRLQTYFFKYTQKGWVASDQKSSEASRAFNPHTGLGKGDDGAAHSRAICCIKFIRS